MENKIEHKIIKITYGFSKNGVRTFVLPKEMSREIWDKSAALHSDPEYVWIFEEPSDQERDKYNKLGHGYEIT